MANNSLRPLNFAGKLFFILLAAGIFQSFVLVAEFHLNPFRVPTFSDIPICYIYGNAYIAIILSALLKKSVLTQLLESAGFTLGILISAYFLLVWIKFGGSSHIFPAEIFGIKTIYTDFLFFVILLVLRILKKP